MGSNLHRTLIVGASAAGLGVAENLRVARYAGDVVVIDKQSDQPCDRPPLSKSFLLAEEIDIALPYAAAAAEESVEILLDEEAIAVDLASQRLTCVSGLSLEYSTLVVATGSSPRRLTVRGSETVDIHVIRDHHDARQLREAAQTARSAFIVGAGVLGLEVASSLRQRGLDVEVITNVDVPLLPVFGPEVAQFERGLMRKSGVRFSPNTSVAEYSRSGSGIQVRLNDGRVVQTDLVVEAVGAQPSTDWLKGSGVTINDGIECDAMLSAAPNVFAAGDACRWFNPRYQRSMRVEHWTNASDQAATVANNIVSDIPIEHRSIPYFWSDHFDCHLQFAGMTSGSTERICESASPDSLVVRYLDQAGTEIGVLSINEPRPIVRHRLGHSAVQL